MNTRLHNTIVDKRDYTYDADKFHIGGIKRCTTEN